MIKLPKIIAVVGIVVLTIGFIYLAYFASVEYPRFRMGAELAKTRYQVGENISVKPYLINMGERPITVFGGWPILFAKVYDAENRQVMGLPIWPALTVLAPHALKPRVPYYAETHSPEGFTFTLDKPGRFKVVAWAEFSLSREHVYPMRIYADPIWIEVVSSSN